MKQLDTAREAETNVTTELQRHTARPRRVAGNFGLRDRYLRTRRDTNAATAEFLELVRRAGLVVSAGEAALALATARYSEISSLVDAVRSGDDSPVEALRRDPYMPDGTRFYETQLAFRRDHPLVPDRSVSILPRDTRWKLERLDAPWITDDWHLRWAINGGYVFATEANVRSRGQGVWLLGQLPTLEIATTIHRSVAGQSEQRNSLVLLAQLVRARR